MAATTGTDTPITGINITPFVDVVLVLMIIFMATSSYISNPAIEVELPQAASGGETVETSLALVLDKQGKLYLDGEAISDDDLAQRCRVESQKNPKIQAIISADGASRHSQVVHVIDLVKLNGVLSFALNIDPFERSPSKHAIVAPL